jgi:hypothetical protein
MKYSFKQLGAKPLVCGLSHFMLLVACISLQRLGFNLWPGHVDLVVSKWELGQI